MKLQARCRRALATLTAAGFWFSTWPAFGQRQPGPGYGFGDHMMWDGWFGWMMNPLAMILWIVIFIVLVALAVRWLSGRGNQSETPPRSAIDALQERYARGEIDRKEYEERRRVLEN